MMVTNISIIMKTLIFGKKTVTSDFALRSNQNHIALVNTVNQPLLFAAVNLEDQTTEVVWQGEGYHISLSVIHDDYIYFIGGKAQGVFKNGIGVFDRQKNEVVWQTEIELEDYVVLNQIQVGDNKIYVLDNEGTLRIYEREDQI